MIEKIDALAADIDMTLTAKGGPLPGIVVDAFRALHNKGVKIGIATGREIGEHLIRMDRSWNLGFDLDFVVGMNGGMVYDRETDSMWTTDMMSRAEMKEILTYMMPLIDKYEIAVNAEGGENHNAMNIGPELLASARRHGFVFTDRTGDIDGFCETPSYKFLFRTEPEYEQEIRTYFLKKYSEKWQIVSTFPGTLEIMHKGFDKGTGMARYAAAHNIRMENVIAFGDNENDNPLLESCGWGVCLANGAEKTRELADAVTEYTCEEGGVGHYIFDHILAA